MPFFFLEKVEYFLCLYAKSLSNANFIILVTLAKLYGFWWPVIYFLCGPLKGKFICFKIFLLLVYRTVPVCQICSTITNTLNVLRIYKFFWSGSPKWNVQFVNFVLCLSPKPHQYVKLHNSNITENYLFI